MRTGRLLVGLGWVGGVVVCARLVVGPRRLRGRRLVWVGFAGKRVGFGRRVDGILVGLGWVGGVGWVTWCWVVNDPFVVFYGLALIMVFP